MNPTIVLITDDDDDDRYFLRQAIERKIAKVTVIEAQNGEEALKSLTVVTPRKRVDLVLLDMNMPGISGLDVLGELRKNPQTRNTPAVMISTSAEPDLVMTAYAKGINSYIKKPNAISEYDRIAEAIKVCFLDVPVIHGEVLPTVAV